MRKFKLVGTVIAVAIMVFLISLSQRTNAEGKIIGIDGEIVTISSLNETWEFNSGDFANELNVGDVVTVRFYDKGIPDKSVWEIEKITPTGFKRMEAK